MVEAEEMSDFVLDEELEVVMIRNHRRIDLNVGLGRVAAVVIPIRRQREKVLPCEELVDEPRWKSSRDLSIKRVPERKRAAGPRDRYSGSVQLIRQPHSRETGHGNES